MRFQIGFDHFIGILLCTRRISVDFIGFSIENPIWFVIWPEIDRFDQIRNNKINDMS